MPIKESQRLSRKKSSGSSDLAKQENEDRFGGPYDVWADKTGQLVERPVNEAMVAGSRFEPSVLEFAEEQLGPLRRNQYRSRPEFHLHANIDAIVRASGYPVEAKTAGLFSPITENWGAEGTDEVPPRVIIQAHAHMICLQKTGYSPKLCHVPVFLGGRGFLMFVVPFNEKLADLLVAHNIDFWQTYVIPRVPPPASLPSLEVAKLLRREPNKVVEIDAKLVETWQNAKETLKHSKHYSDAASAQIFAALGDAECGDAGEIGQMTYFSQNSSPSCDFAALKRDGLFGKYCKQGTHRVLRFKKPKGVTK